MVTMCSIYYGYDVSLVSRHMGKKTGPAYTSVLVSVYHGTYFYTIDMV
jgi:hypothetical protein